MVIEVNKDIDRYKESVVMGLTARQLIFSVASVVIGGGIVLLVYPYVGLTVSAYIAIPVVAPIALNGFYSYNGMTFMQMMKKKLHFAFGNKPITYLPYLCCFCNGRHHSLVQVYEAPALQRQ